MAPNRWTKGRRAEQLAADYLQRQGLEVVERNFRCPLGEIDLICRHEKTLVFVEVRSRSHTRFGSPQESISSRKQRRLVLLAQWYLKSTRQGKLACRFDVIAIVWDKPEPELTWIRNAFEALT